MGYKGSNIRAKVAPGCEEDETVDGFVEMGRKHVSRQNENDGCD